MKRVKTIIVVSIIFSLSVSLINFLKGLLYEIDCYDFAYIYKYLRPSIILLVVSMILLAILFVLLKKRAEDINIEKVFSIIFVILAIGYGISYLSGNIGIYPLHEKVSMDEEDLSYKSVNLQDQKYLPFCDDFSDRNISSYELYRSHLMGTTMINITADIKNEKSFMDYELEFINSKDALIFTKFVLQRLYFDNEKTVTSGTKNTYTVDDNQIDIYKYFSNYSASMYTPDGFMFVTLHNAKLINEQDFLNACVEQYGLMKEVIARGSL